MQISTLIGKPVLTRAGDRLGYVTAAYLTRDRKKLSSLACADDEEEEFYLPARAVLAAADAVIAGMGRLNAPTGEPCPIGKRAYSAAGEALGTVTDCEIGDAPALLIDAESGRHAENRKSEGIAADMGTGADAAEGVGGHGESGVLRCEIERAAIGETVIVYPTAAEKRPMPAKRRKIKVRQTPHAAGSTAGGKPQIDRAPPDAPQSPEKAANAINRAAETGAADGTDGAKNGLPPPMSETVPPKSQASDVRPQEMFRIDRTNLLGRRVKRSVFDETGAPVALAGERITPDTVAKARRKNKLLALTVNTLTNIDM